LQLGPVLELWQQLISSTPGLLTKKTKEASTGGSSSAAGSKKVQDPVDDFVSMEFELAGDICAVIDASLSALKKVRYIC